MSNLELATTEELITELFSRVTFVGVIVYSPSDHKTSGQSHKNFKLATSADHDSTVYILETASNIMNSRLAGGESC